MTGEMSKADVTREAFPLHFAVADEFGGEVRPFDVYQGPYVAIPGKGRFWLLSDDGMDGFWWSERQDKRSDTFPCAEIFAPLAVEIFRDLGISDYPACAICGEKHDPARGLSYDGRGVNDCSMYRERLATLSEGARQAGLGPVFAAAPELLAVVTAMLNSNDSDTRPLMQAVRAAAAKAQS